ncbi:nuclease domain-containing protein [Endozoicomonas sp. 4G]|uniref:nuclease domain-containing protein n=1 Tax=Endozoicomonas sp. 4G TaxID=2872754 RepID=UPI002078BFB2|nr:nuclease domain-containing protein [Endozoicomonas sp. 4G]
MQHYILHLELLDGARRGVTLSLPVKGDSHPSVCRVKEDESLRLAVVLPEHWENVTIAVADQLLEPTEWSEVDSGIEYVWIPNKQKNKYTPYFRNYFGIANFEISAHNTITGLPEIIVFSEIEVLARRLNAERASQMLDYLFQKSFPLHATTSPTRQKGSNYYGSGSYDGNGETPTQRLDALEHICSVLEQNIPIIARRPLTRLRQKRVVEPVYGKDLNASEASIQWLARNTDQLTPETDKENAHLQLDDQLYRVSQLAVQKPTGSTDITENRRILGVLRNLQQQIEDLISSIENRICSIEKKGQGSGTTGAYVSFFNCLSHHVRQLNQTRLYRCERLKTRLQVCTRIYERSVPVRQPDLSITISAKAKSNHSYRDIMLAALKLYGSIDWKQEDIFLAIHSIPKLYELFCLEQLKEALHKVPDMVTKQDIKLATGSDRGKHAAFSWEDWNISLLYQPIFPTEKSGDALSIINSEGWTERYDGSLVERIKNKREPDYIIDIQHITKDYRYIIVLDAKYTHSENAYSRDLKSSVMKYVHGLHLLKGGFSPVIGLYILFPEEGARSFHHEHFGIMSEQPVLPVLTTHSMSPRYSSTLNNLERKLHKLMSAATKTVKPSS